MLFAILQCTRCDFSFKWLPVCPFHCWCKCAAVYLSWVFAQQTCVRRLFALCMAKCISCTFLSSMLPQNVISYCLNLGNAFLWSFSKLSLDAVVMLKPLAFQTCLTAAGICPSTFLLQSKLHEQKLITPKEILYPWVCSACKRRPSFRFVSRLYPWWARLRSESSRVVWVVFKSSKHTSSMVLFCGGRVCALHVTSLSCFDKVGVPCWLYWL